MTLFDLILIAVFAGWYGGNAVYRRWPDAWSQICHRAKSVGHSLEYIGKMIASYPLPFGSKSNDGMSRSYANTFPPGPKEIEHRKRHLINECQDMYSVLPWLTDQDFHSAAYLCCTGDLEESKALTMLADLDHHRGQGEEQMTTLDLLDDEQKTGVETSIEWSSDAIREAVTMGMVTTEEATSAIEAMLKAMYGDEAEVPIDLEDIPKHGVVLNHDGSCTVMANLGDQHVRWLLDAIRKSETIKVWGRPYHLIRMEIVDTATGLYWLHIRSEDGLSPIDLDGDLEPIDVTTKDDAGRVYCLSPEPEQGYRKR